MLMIVRSVKRYVPLHVVVGCPFNIFSSVNYLFDLSVLAWYGHKGHIFVRSEERRVGKECRL